MHDLPETADLVIIASGSAGAVLGARVSEGPANAASTLGLPSNTRRG